MNPDVQGIRDRVIEADKDGQYMETAVSTADVIALCDELDKAREVIDRIENTGLEDRAKLERTQEALRIAVEEITGIRQLAIEGSWIALAAGQALTKIKELGGA